MLYFYLIFRLVRNVTLLVFISFWIFVIRLKLDQRTLSPRCTLISVRGNFGLLVTLISHDAWLQNIFTHNFVSVFILKRNKSINIEWDFYNFLELDNSSVFHHSVRCLAHFQKLPCSILHLWNVNMLKEETPRKTFRKPPFSCLSGKHLIAHMATAPTIGGTPAPKNAPV